MAGGRQNIDVSKETSKAAQFLKKELKVSKGGEAIDVIFKKAIKADYPALFNLIWGKPKGT